MPMNSSDIRSKHPNNVQINAEQNQGSGQERVYLIYLDSSGYSGTRSHPLCVDSEVRQRKRPTALPVPYPHVYLELHPQSPRNCRSPLLYLKLLSNTNLMLCSSASKHGEMLPKPPVPHSKDGNGLKRKYLFLFYNQEKGTAYSAIIFSEGDSYQAAHNTLILCQRAHTRSSNTVRQARSKLYQPTHPRCVYMYVQ